MSLNNNNIITNASIARYESDRDYIQSVLELAIQKVVLKHKGGIELESGPLNETIKDVKLTEGRITWTSKKLLGLTGEIIFDDGEDTDTTFYVGEKLPVYGSETTWYVDKQGRVVLQVASKVLGADEVPKGKINSTEIKENASEYYGRTVIYESEKGKNYEWQIFHADEGGIYLITKDYVKREDIPNSWKNGVETANKPNNGDNSNGVRSAYFSNILSDYENGSADVEEHMKNLNTSYFIDKGYTSYYKNMQAVAYMLDIRAWSKYKDYKANYAIGGPSLELLCKSYNTYKGSEVLLYDAANSTGYQICNDGENWSTYLTGVFFVNDAYGMYRIIAAENARGYWLASPSSNYDNYVMHAGGSGSLGSTYHNRTDLGFRPVVYLKSSTGLVEQDDGTFIVK